MIPCKGPRTYSDPGGRDQTMAPKGGTNDAKDDTASRSLPHHPILADPRPETTTTLGPRIGNATVPFARELPATGFAKDRSADARALSLRLLSQNRRSRSLV